MKLQLKKAMISRVNNVKGGLWSPYDKLRPTFEDESCVPIRCDMTLYSNCNCSELC